MKIDLTAEYEAQLPNDLNEDQNTMTGSTCRISDLVTNCRMPESKSHTKCHDNDEYQC